MRVDRWETLLADAVEAARNTPFEWGVNDCVTWAFDVRSMLTGQPSAADAWRGSYASEAGAARRLRRLGHTDLAAGGRALLGEPLPSVLLAQRGDIVLTPDGRGAAVCIGGFVVGMAPGVGLTAQPLAPCSLAWRV